MIKTETKLQRARIYVIFGLIISAVGYFTHDDTILLLGGCVTGWCLGMLLDAKLNNK